MAYLRYGVPADGWGEESGIPLNGYGWLGKFEFNLYGDPTVSLGLCEEDAECSDGSLCNGEGRCLEGYCVQGELVDCASLDDVCIVGECDHATGTCSSVPRPQGTECDDGLFCTEEDLCVEGGCGGSPRDCGEAPEGFVSVCNEELLRCEIEPEVVEPADGDADEDRDLDAASDADDEEDQLIYTTGGGGCSAVSSPAPGFVNALLRLF